MIALVALLTLAAAPEAVVSSTLTVTLTPTVADAIAEQVVVSGNRVLSAQVYRALVNLPENARLTPRTARRAEHDIVRFLKLAGYELAEVKVTVEGKQLHVEVDEGRLERVVFLGSTGLGTLRLQLMLDMPERVFNRSDLESQLDRFRREEGIHITEYRLIAIKTSTASGVVQVPSEVGGVELLREAGRYELHILMDEPDYPPGLGLELRGEPADGIVSAVRYRFADMILDNDRVEVAGLFGFRPQKVFASEDRQRWVSRAGARAAWVSPALPQAPLRFLFGSQGHWGSRARDDLGIVRYDLVEAIADVRVRVRPSRFIELEAGGGALLHMITSVAADTFGPDEKPRYQPIVFLRGELLLGDDDVRLDRLHEIELDLMQVFGADARARVNMTYEKSVGFGFDDLVFAAAGSLVLGERPFYALDRVGEYAKGAYGDLLYAWALGAGGVEYRLSLSRELIKIGFAYDVCGFARDLGNRETEPGLVQALSVGLHALILDSFRFSIYGVGAWAVGETPEPGVSISLSQVF